ncbi:MAG: efflux RND transporter permease subunit [Candidatus Aminicenantes bacterium]|nr:efflux RND transporter permease subunit [Candidatus Aminicenantes bacterium]
MRGIDLSVKRPVGTIMFFVGIILLGYISLSKLSINLLPDLSYPKLTVFTQYPGSGPEEIEKFITRQLEGPLSSVPNVKKITSVSREGNSLVTLEFHWGTDMDFALLHTKEKATEAESLLPDDCDSPIILEWDPSSSPILISVLKSDKMNLKELKDTAEFIIKPRLEQLQGISKVEIRGGFEEEISVEIDPEMANNIGVSLSEVARAIQSNHIFRSGGMVRKDKYRYTLKIEAEIREPEEIEEIVVKRIEGRNVLIKDIGRAFYKNKVKQGEIRFDAKAVISILAYRESGGNTVDATIKAEQALEQMAKEIKDLEYMVIAREADLIISSIQSLSSSLFLGGILAIFILLLFLQNFRDPLLISTVIPISIISTFVLMFFFKVNINIMSLGGLVLGVGMFVDNSIIVLESIFRHRHKDKEKLLTSIIKGTKEVSGAITASTFTTISIFLPVIYLYGITGKLFKDQALTVSFSLISSLLVALTLLPALSGFKATFKTGFYEAVEKRKDKKWFQYPLEGLNLIFLLPLKVLGNVLFFILAGIMMFFKYLFKLLGKFLNFFFKPLFRGFNRLYNTFDAFYHNILEKILNKKIIALVLSIFIILFITGTFLLLKKELLPTPDSSKFEINANTMPEFGFNETNRIALRIEETLRAVEDVEFVFTEAGAVSQVAGRSEEMSVNSIHFIVKCKSPKKRAAAMQQARELLNREREYQSLQNFSIFLEKNTLSQYLSLEGENFQVKVFYEDIETGKEAVNSIINRIENLKGLVDLKATTSEGKPIFAVSFKQDLLDSLNITKEQVAEFINQAVRGQKAETLKKMQKSFDIFVRVPVTGILEMRRLLSLPVSINNNTYYLNDMVEIVEIDSIKEISRESQERYFLISGNVKGENLERFISRAESIIAELELPRNTRYIFAGEEEERRKAFDSLNEAIWLALILVYMIMAAKFENLFQPFIIMLTVPMGLIGAFLFLLVSGNSLSIISGIGILVLIGIGVNDAIVKVEYSNQLRKQGLGIREAVMTASKVRLRPILMTTFTTIFGLVPMALMTQTGSELQRPLALVIIGGLFFTTFLTLIFIPVCYELLENMREKRKAKSSMA